MDALQKPLTIFLFNGCTADLCKSTRTLLLRYLSTLSVLISKEVSYLRGKEVNVVISEGRTIRGMNRKFRGIDSATDVLSFPLGEEEVGEVWICPSVIERNSKLFDQRYKDELLRVCIHGILHLGGFDHKGSFFDEKASSEEMFVLQERIHAAVISTKE